MAAPIMFVAGPGPAPLLPPNLRYYSATTTPHASIRWLPLETEPAYLGPHLKHFHYFSKLPIELRLRIWSFAAPHQRVIELRSWGDNVTNPYTPVKIIVARHKPPVILHVNQESRREGLRIYKTIKIGISVSNTDPSQIYLPWAHHPLNPHGIPGYQVRGNPPLAWPHPPREIYFSPSRDIIYLGSDFRAQHLQAFFTATGPSFELADLQYLALDRKLWIGSQGRWDYLRYALYALKSRPVKEIYIVPDDEKFYLADNLYYHSHEVSLHPAPCKYRFRPEGEKDHSATIAENLQEFFVRLWKDSGIQVPKVEVKSVRRRGRRMEDFKEGLWDIQKNLGDMRVWKTWVPSSS